MDDLIEIGRLTKVHGVDGRLVLKLNESIDSDGIDAEFLFLELDGQFVPHKLESMDLAANDKLIVKLKYIDQPEEADRMRDVRVLCSSEDIEGELEEYPDFTGFMVRTKDMILGTLSEVQRGVHQDLMIVRNQEGKEFLIPAVEEFVVDINEEEQVIEVNVPDELLSIND